MWSIVLAAGQGRRLATVTGGVPKQFWSPSGDQTLLEQTLDRLSPLVLLTRTVTVIDRSQRALATALLKSSGRESLGLLLDQPSDRGTAAGVALGLSTIAAMEPDPIVVLTPSDHAVAGANDFVRGLRHAATVVARRRERVVLFGVEPAGAAGDYGWISTAGAATARSGCRRVTAFVEKPGPARAASLLASGAVWNTMVLVSRVSELLALYETSLPEMFAVFDRARRLGPRGRSAFLAEAYERMPGADFSRDVLACAAGLSIYTWPASLGWSDLGTPDRLAAWRTTVRTAFPRAS